MVASGRYYLVLKADSMREAVSYFIRYLVC